MRNIVKVFYALSLSILMLGCQRGPVKQSDMAPKEAPVKATATATSSQEKFLYEPNYQASVINTCRDEPKFKGHTDYGSWSVAKDCQIYLHETGETFAANEIDIHYSRSDGSINAVRYIALPSSPHGKEIEKKYGDSIVHRSDNICIQYGLRRLPVITIAKPELCDALEYGAI